MSAIFTLKWIFTVLTRAWLSVSNSKLHRFAATCYNYTTYLKPPCLDNDSFQAYITIKYDINPKSKMITRRQGGGSADVYEHTFWEADDEANKDNALI
jgi:hypothetical protein